MSENTESSEKESAQKCLDIAGKVMTIISDGVGITAITVYPYPGAGSVNVQLGNVEHAEAFARTLMLSDARWGNRGPGRGAWEGHWGGTLVTVVGYDKEVADAAATAEGASS